MLAGDGSAVRPAIIWLDQRCIDEAPRFARQVGEELIHRISGKLVKRSETMEASCLGAGVWAAAGAGWFPNMEAAAESMSGAITEEIAPEPDHRSRYAELLGIYRELYPRLRETFAKLSRFAAGI